MRFHGYWWGDTESGLARWISPDKDDAGKVSVPVARTTFFKKLATKNPDEIPRECEFELESWLTGKPEFEPFETV